MYRVHPALLERTLVMMAKTSQNTIRLKTAKRALLENHLLTSQTVQFVVRASIKTPTTNLVHRVHPVLLEPTLMMMAKPSQNTMKFQTARHARKATKLLVKILPCVVSVGTASTKMRPK